MSDKKTPAGVLAEKSKEYIEKTAQELIPTEVLKAINTIPSPKDGVDGLGFNAKSWEPSIYREGSIVQHNFGQCFKALKDTNEDPNASEDWERVGNVGFRWTGLKQADFPYIDGDLFIDGGSCFLVHEGKAKMFVQRGKNGKDGVDGKDGKAGSDAPSIIHMEHTNKALSVAFDNGDVYDIPLDLVTDEVTYEAAKKTLLWIEEQWAVEEEIGIRFRIFRGAYKRGESYSKGDCVNFNSSLYIANEADSKSPALDSDKWIKIAGKGGGGGGGGGAGVFPPPTLTQPYVYQFLPAAPGTNFQPSGQWVRQGNAAVTVVNTLTDLLALDQNSLISGMPVYVKSNSHMYSFTGIPTAPANSLTDWTVINSGANAPLYNRVSDLPVQNSTNPVRAGDLAVVRVHTNGIDPQWRVYFATISSSGNLSWVPTDQQISAKDLATDPNYTDSSDHDIQITTEAGHKDIKIFDAGTNAWINVFSEDEVKRWIAAGNLFVGTVEETGHGIAGAIDFANMPAESALGASDKGHYWVFVGTAGHPIGPTEVGGAASSIAGQALNVGDWIQVAETTPAVYATPGDPTSALVTPAVFAYTVIPGDLLAKSRGDSLYGLNQWTAGAYEQGSIVVRDGKVYKASVPILNADPAPDATANTKWAVVPISAGLHNVPADANLPATAAAGDVYLVLNSARANNLPAFYIYDNVAAQWQPIGGAGGSGSALDLSGGDVIYPKVYNDTGIGNRNPATGQVIGDLLTHSGQTDHFDVWDGTKWIPAIPQSFRIGRSAPTGGTALPQFQMMMPDGIHHEAEIDGNFYCEHGQWFAIRFYFDGGNSPYDWVHGDFKAAGYAGVTAHDGDTTGTGGSTLAGYDGFHNGTRMMPYYYWTHPFKPGVNTNPAHPPQNMNIKITKGQNSDIIVKVESTYWSINSTFIQGKAMFWLQTSAVITGMQIVGIDDRGTYGGNVWGQAKVRYS